MASIQSAINHVTQVGTILLLFVVYVLALSVKTVANVVKRRLTGEPARVEGIQAPPEP